MDQSVIAIGSGDQEVIQTNTRWSNYRDAGKQIEASEVVTGYLGCMGLLVTPPPGNSNTG